MKWVFAAFGSVLFVAEIVALVYCPFFPLKLVFGLEALLTGTLTVLVIRTSP